MINSSNILLTNGTFIYAPTAAEINTLKLALSDPIYDDAGQHDIDAMSAKTGVPADVLTAAVNERYKLIDIDLVPAPDPVDPGQGGGPTPPIVPEPTKPVRAPTVPAGARQPAPRR